MFSWFSKYYGGKLVTLCRILSKWGYPGELFIIMQLIIPQPSPLDAESDADLLLAIFAGNETERRLAANAFFRRYARNLYGFCRQFQQTLGGEAVVSSLVLMTFQRAFERAGTFNCNGNMDQEHCAQTFQWLATMSKNLMLDWLKSIGKEHPLPLTSIMIPDHQVGHDQEDTIPRRYVRLLDNTAENLDGPTAYQECCIGNDDEVLLTMSAESECLQKALATLTERERDIILISALYSGDGKQLRLPQDILEGLCKHLETTKENIRTIRRRAHNKIKKYVETHC